jgi:hypothetical protein
MGPLKTGTGDSRWGKSGGVEDWDLTPGGEIGRTLSGGGHPRLALMEKKRAASAGFAANRCFGPVAGRVDADTGLGMHAHGTSVVGGCPACPGHGEAPLCLWHSRPRLYPCGTDHPGARCASAGHCPYEPRAPARGFRAGRPVTGVPRA